MLSTFSDNVAKVFIFEPSLHRCFMLAVTVFKLCSRSSQEAYYQNFSVFGTPPLSQHLAGLRVEALTYVLSSDTPQSSQSLIDSCMVDGKVVPMLSQESCNEDVGGSET